MAITTRSVTVALEAGCIVDFGARDPLGPVSVGIFMAYAFGCKNDSPLLPSMTKILSFCGGLPIALSVAGCAVALLVRTVASFERACNIYAVEFEERNTGLGDERTRISSSLRTGILLSLKYLDTEFSKWKANNSPHFEHSVSDLYASLSVLSNQLWVPISVLSRMWKLDEKFALDVAKLFCEMSLATLSYRNLEDGSEKPGITVHDLHLDFCRRRAKEQNSSFTWHAELLNGYLGGVPPADERRVADTLSSCSSDDIVACSPRTWWCASILEDRYIHDNLARHLACSGQYLELAALLMDIRWTHVRFKIGGITALKKDFQCLEESQLYMNCKRGKNGQSEEIVEGFKMILKAAIAFVG